MYLLARLLLVIPLMLCCGCPDYSHLRNAPDNSEMVDDGTELSDDAEMEE